MDKLTFSTYRKHSNLTPISQTAIFDSRMPCGALGLLVKALAYQENRAIKLSELLSFYWDGLDEFKRQIEALKLLGYCMEVLMLHPGNEETTHYYFTDDPQSLADFQKQLDPSVRKVEPVKVEKETEPPPYVRKPSPPRDIQEVKEFFYQQGRPEQDAINFFNHYAATGWYIGQSPITNWRSKALSWGNGIQKPQPDTEEIKNHEQGQQRRNSEFWDKQWE